jgi:hypothetical protein
MDKRKHANKTITILMCCVCLIASLTLVLFAKNMLARAASPLWDGSVATGFAGGTGTEADPYLISDGAQLAYFAREVNNNNNSYDNKYIKLTRDILLNEMNPDGTFVSASPRELFTRNTYKINNNFKGHFDGDGKKIIGLYININSWIYYAGLFGYAAAESVIQNVSISGVVIGGYETGVIAGHTDGVITGCDISCTVIGGATHTGGITGSAGADSEISNCTVTGTVNGARNYVGGVAGITQGIIKECDISGAVTGEESYVGGITGSAGADSEISNCTVSGTVDGKSYVGGMAGQTQGIIKECSVSGTVTGFDFYVGGMAGYAAGQSEVSACSASGAVSGRSYVGGMVGKTDNTTVTGCTSDCTVTGIDFYIGGVAGYAGTGSEVSACSNTGDVSGRSSIGGVAGHTDGIITVCVNSGDVTGLEEKIGGIAGYADMHNTVSNCLNTGAVTATGDGDRDGIGGIVGIGNWSDPASTIHNNLSLGYVDGRVNVGGIIGRTEAPLTPQDAWNNYYCNAPAGTGGGDVLEEDGAVPFGDMTWEEVIDELNSDNPAGDDIWSEDQSGIPIPGIFVPKAAVEVLNARIKGGKYFTPTPVGAGTSATITADSVFTVVFSMRYNETCHLDTQLLGLANEGAAVSLPANTSIIMLVDGDYYYKNLAAQLETRLALSEFIKMGSTTENYAPAEPAPANTTKEYLFIFDFSKTSGVAAGSFDVELLPAAATHSGTMPSVTVTGQNTYVLDASAANNQLTVNLSRAMVDGYDYKTDGKSYAYELQLEQGGVAVPWPVGTKINGIPVFSVLPYVFAAAPFEGTTISIDMSDCVNPLAQGTYNVRLKAYACTAGETPREGYFLASGVAPLTVAAPVQYGIRASAPIRVFDYSPSAIPVEFNVETLGAGTVKSTLQRKYGTVYVNIADQTDLPVTLNGGSATLTVPAGYEKGTYRFVLTIYDSNNTPRAQSTESLIIK